MTWWKFIAGCSSEIAEQTMCIFSFCTSHVCLILCEITVCYMEKVMQSTTKEHPCAYQFTFWPYCVTGNETRTPLDTPLSRLGVLENLHMVGPYPPTPPQSYAHMLGSVRTVDHQPTDLSVYSSGHMRDLKVWIYFSFYLHNLFFHFAEEHLSLKHCFLKL